MRLAHELKKQLHEVMGWPAPMTEKQYRVWGAWLEGEQDRPSRADYYQMATRFELQLMNRRESVEFPRDQQLRFRTQAQRQESEMTVEEQIAADKAMWVAASGGRAVRRSIPREELSG